MTSNTAPRPSAFDRCVAFVLRAEGTLSNDPRDNGGLTKYGISQKSYPNLDIQKLTVEAAIEIYRRDFWDELQLSSVPEHLALIMFDCACNQGPGTSAALMQITLKLNPPDGVVGPKTLAALQSCEPLLTIKEFQKKRLIKYKRHEDWPVFGLGWAVRAIDVAAQALWMAMALEVLGETEP